MKKSNKRKPDYVPAMAAISLWFVVASIVIGINHPVLIVKQARVVQKAQKEMPKAVIKTTRKLVTKKARLKHISEHLKDADIEYARLIEIPPQIDNLIKKQLPSYKPKDFLAWRMYKGYLYMAVKSTDKTEYFKIKKELYTAILDYNKQVAGRLKNSNKDYGAMVDYAEKLPIKLARYHARLARSR